MDTTLHYTSVSHADSLMGAINKMRLNSDLCDVAVVIGNFRIMAHRIILSASAPYFYQLFQPCHLQASLKEYHLDDIDETAALKIIEFCYTSAISLDDDIVWPLLSAADKLDCAEISQLCCDYLSSALDATSCLPMHKKSLQFNCSKMLDKTSQFIADHAEQLCASPTLHCLAPQELVTLLTSLRDVSWEEDKLLPFAVAWLDRNGGRGQVVRQLVQEFPDLSDKLQHFLRADGNMEVNVLENSHITDNFGQVLTYSHAIAPGPLLSDLSGVMEAPLHVCVSCGDAFDTAGGLSCHMQVCEELVQTSKERRGVSESPQLHTTKGRCGVSESPQLQASKERRGVSESPQHEGVDSVDSCRTKDSANAPGSCLSDTPEKGKTVAGGCGEGVEVGVAVVDKLDDSHLANTPGLTNPSNPLRLTNPSIVAGSAYPGDLCNKLNPVTNSGMGVSLSGGDVTVFPSDSDKDIINSQGVNDTNNNDINDIPSGDDDCQDNSDDANIEIDVVNDDGESDSQSPHSQSPHRQSPHRQYPHRQSPQSPSPMKQNYISYMTPMEETFTCKICKQEFCKRKSLAKHWRVVHGLHQDTQGGGEDCSDQEGGDDVGETKKLRTDEVGQLEGSCDPQSKMEALDPQFLMEQYLKQYSQFTRWYVEHGLMFCPLCLVYHAKGSTCPRADAAPDGQVKQVLSRREDDQSNCKDEDGPLDMSKTSPTFSSPQSSHIGAQPGANNSSAYVSSPLDISSYYTYAHMLATAGSSDSVDRNQYSLFYPDTQSVLRSMDFAGESIYNPYHRNSLSSTYPLSLVSEARTDSPSVSRYPATPQDSGPMYMAAPPGPQKRKLTSRQGFPCTVCGRVFSYQAALFTHMRTHSPSSRTYECHLCHQVFAQAPDLKVHVCPNGVEKPYNCSSCGQTFAKNIHLKRHLATHSGLKPYPCWVCGKRFSRSDHLKRHTQSIHAGSRPHGCHLCEKEFVRKYELNKHMLTHSVEKLGAEGEQNSGAGITQDLSGWSTEPGVKS
ncbi:uncharacterized protein LOC131942391 [Physella acuta]|uniref:uncharacterized protein LOC131942391 n=1 Tax=Physella acuta TaxID=109671 RepID=UPI0027DD0E3A|nr:uncharacterized protein LOC131942391 [Physella acuta]